MEPLSVTVEISAEGALDVTSWRLDARAPRTTHRVSLRGLDGEVLRLFDRWLRLREREPAWSEDEIRVFGQLLHRRLFPNTVWNWILEQLDARGDEVLRLMLAFQADQASSQLAALPWEYLCAPDRPGQDGQFLVLTPGLMLSRSVPAGSPQRALPDVGRARILPVVGESDNELLGAVDYEEVESAIRDTSEQRGFEVLDTALNVTIDELQALVLKHVPDVVHYMGHAKFDDDQGLGCVALRSPTGGFSWVDEHQLARALCTDTSAPAVVILHACEGGANNYDYRYAGLAPSLVRRGVHCVIAMHYPVRNSTAIHFSTCLYAAIAEGKYLDEAVHVARRELFGSSPDADARLLGLPMVYQRNAAPLLGARVQRASA